jgi:hypothetical protein
MTSRSLESRTDPTYKVKQCKGLGCTRDVLEDGPNIMCRNVGDKLVIDAKRHNRKTKTLTLSDPTSDLVRQYNVPVPLRCRKTSDTVFVAFVCPLSEPVRCFFSCSTDFRQQIAQVVLFLFLHDFLL